MNGFNLVARWRRDGFESLAASNMRDLPPDVDQAKLKDAVDVDYAHKSYAARQEKVLEFHAFLSRMRTGDLVATTSDGVLHLGVITGAAAFVESNDNRSNLRRDVEWRVADAPVTYGDLPAPLAAKLSSQSDVVDLTEDRAVLESLFGDQPDTEETGDLVLRDADDARSPNGC